MLEWINLNGAVVGLVTFLFGLLMGHRFALGRDKRKEWNDVVDRLREPLFKSLRHPDHMGLDRAGADALKQVARTMLTKRRLCAQIDDHIESHALVARAYKQNAAGSVYYTKEQLSAMKIEIEGLLRIVQRI